MKKIIILVFILLSSISLLGCQKNETYDIVTTLFPQFDITRSLMKDTKLTVTNVLPFGVSPHGYELTSKDRQLIEDSNLFIYTSDELEIWATSLSFTETTSINLELELDIEHEEHEHEDASYEEHDVHFWTDPHNLESMLHVIKDKLVELYPEYETIFETNYEVYLSELDDLIEELNTFLMPYLNNPITLYIAGHNAMASFGDFFGIEIVSLFPDFIPDAELTSLELTTFIKSIQDNEIHAFFIEPLFDNEPLAAETIKQTLSSQSYEVTYYVLHQFHNISALDFQNGLTLLDIFEQNISNIKEVMIKNYA